MAKEKKATITYYGNPSLKKKAAKRASKVGRSVGEVIDAYLKTYIELPIYKRVHDGKPEDKIL